MKRSLYLLTPFLTISFALLRIFYENPGEIWASDFVILLGIVTIFCGALFVFYYSVSRKLKACSLGAAIAFMPLIFLTEASLYSHILIGWFLGIGLGLVVACSKEQAKLLLNIHIWLVVFFGSFSAYYVFQIAVSKARIHRQIALVDEELEKRFARLKFSQTSNKMFDGDIYFIILDEFISPLAFKNYYKYDNNTFFSGLGQLGFKVVDNSYSNYPWTIPSVSSMVTMDFHKNWVKKKEFPQIAHHLIRYNFIGKLLESEGYKRHSLPSIYWLGNDNKGTLNDFVFRSKSYGLTLSMMRSTPLAQLARKLQRKYHREHILSQLDSIERFACSDHDKTFLFAHFLCPHRPIVFDKDGKKIAEEKIACAEKDKKHEYALDQAYFISNEIRGLVQKILKNSKRSPIVVLVSDHGKFPIGKKGKGKTSLKMKDLSWRFSNFIAVYHPDKSYVSKEFTTAVNVFRNILSQTFGYDLPLREDVVHPDSFDYSNQYPAQKLISFQTQDSGF